MKELDKQFNDLLTCLTDLKQMNEEEFPSFSPPVESIKTVCQQLLLELYSTVGNDVAPHLLPVFNQLISIQNGLDVLRVSENYSLEDVQKFQSQLHNIEELHVKDLKFVVDDGSAILKGQALLYSKLNHCCK